MSTAVMGLAACSTGGAGSPAFEDPGAEGGQATAGGGGGAGPVGGSPSSGGTGAGGSPAVSRNKLEVCLAYAKAQCNRRMYECRGLPPVEEPCRVDSCPDLLFSEGSLRTVDNVIACTEEWKRFPCEQAVRDLSPACVEPGSRLPGSTCFHPSQCSTLACVGVGDDPTHPRCGRCGELAQPGEVCGASGPVCPTGQDCVSGACGEPGIQHELVPKGGEPCTGECVPGFVCRGATVGAPRTCSAPLPLGAACENVGDCGGGALCVGATCVMPPPIGQPCNQGYCAADAYCGPPVNSVPLCVPDLTVGGDCTGAGTQCAAGLGCLCVDEGCLAKRCGVSLQPGEACAPSDPDRKCRPGSECRNGKCEGLESQGLFAERCGG